MDLRHDGQDPSEAGLTDACLARDLLALRGEGPTESMSLRARSQDKVGMSRDSDIIAALALFKSASEVRVTVSCLASSVARLFFLFPFSAVNCPR